jgi:hypothetical protein
MHNTITEDHVSHALRSLGETAEDIAGNLLAGGWLGLRENSGACPVALYLTTTLPNVNSTVVGFERATVYVVGGWVIKVELTDAVAEFVREFDTGTFPELSVQDTDDNGDVIEDF